MAGSAEADLPVVVDVVVAEPVVAGVAVVCWDGFRCRGVGLGGCSAIESAVRAALVVVLAEGVELLLQLGVRVGAGSGGEPAFQGLVEAFDLSLGLRVVGGAVLLSDVQCGEDVFEGVAAAAVAGGVDASVVGERGCGCAVLVDAGEERGGLLNELVTVSVRPRGPGCWS
ncbi:hypothetical protein J2Y69_001950 [Microbacterium resistens]|uniref:Uncharacterized protein n=1 Tax=Microbacterium resistens TaxID=156977 RepID=A0ABU1SCQ3_9MICO|nr:hypothetical protein [Microbacterium resistens]MDR6867349.1 hypothetical protein [Microbacterium resistens]